MKRAGTWKHNGQQQIDSDRAREIQEALIRENYMSGKASGMWDAQTKAALAKYQGAHGWQTKRVPDSRALIQLGLGPNHVANPNTELASTPQHSVTVSESGVGAQHR